jgi:hypothetical protein
LCRFDDAVDGRRAAAAHRDAYRAASQGGGMVRVKSPQDLGAAGVFILIGLAGLVFGWELEFGSASRMGPGYFPMLLSCLILAIGIGIGWRAFVIAGPPVARFHLRPMVFLIVAILSFGLIVNWIGLALTTAVLTFIAANARRRASLPETLVLAGVLAVFVVLVFVYGLSQPFPAWWGQ